MSRLTDLLGVHEDEIFFIKFFDEENSFITSQLDHIFLNCISIIAPWDDEDAWEDPI